jgi:hypothetical protein
MDNISHRHQLMIWSESLPVALHKIALRKRGHDPDICGSRTEELLIVKQWQALPMSLAARQKASDRLHGPDRNIYLTAELTAIIYDSRTKSSGSDPEFSPQRIWHKINVLVGTLNLWRIAWRSGHPLRRSNHRRNRKPTRWFSNDLLEIGLQERIIYECHFS